MDAAPDDLANDIDALKAALVTERAKALQVAVELAVAHAEASQDLALMTHQKLRIAKLERQLYRPRSERSERLIDQLALTFTEQGASATEDELAADIWLDTPASFRPTEERLQVCRRGGRKRALGTRAPMALPEAANQRWSLDFVSDSLTDGRLFRVLCVVDDFTRECLALVADTSLSAIGWCVNLMRLPPRTVTR